MGLYKQIISRFPRGSLSYVFAYGSGVKQQLGQIKENNVIDFIFCVKDPIGWHAENISRHPSHYSAMRHLGPQFIAKYQANYGAGVYFNTLVPLSDVGVTIKYGVTCRDSMIKDLNDWKYLYIAGRLHKPVFNVVPVTDDAKLSKAIDGNLRSAFVVALLLLPERFSSFELFHAISALSYKGDFRMIFGENKQKVANIVKAQESEFMELYKPTMTQLTDYVAVDFSAKERGSGTHIIQFEQDKSAAATEAHLRVLPSELRKTLIRNAAFRGSYADIIEQLAGSHNLAKTLQASVNDLVWKSSITQTIKNIPSAGVAKSIIYGYRKAMKTFSK